jgi:uncharacterized protein (TIGR00730 family)
MLSSIAVFCGSSTGTDPAFKQLTQDLGRFLAQNQIEIVYGAGNVGLMGVLADAALAENGQVVGVIPHFLKEWEVCHTGLTELIVVDTMHQRKAIMAERADGFLVLPGGFGTLDEFFEILTWRQLHLHDKPIGILNWKGYYDHLLAHANKMMAEGYLRKENMDLFVVEATAEDLLKQLKNNRPDLKKKWL